MKMAEGVGFEPTREQNPLPVFKTGALNRSATLPSSILAKSGKALIAHTSICDGSNQIATPAAGPAASVHFRTLGKRKSPIATGPRSVFMLCTGEHWPRRAERHFSSLGVAILLVAERPARPDCADRWPASAASVTRGWHGIISVLMTSTQAKRGENHGPSK